MSEDETHPSFGLASFSRVRAVPGASLFDSEIRHSGYITFSVRRATRVRELARDWLHAEGLPLIEVAMSSAQFGALVSSFGEGGGVPVTIQFVRGKRVAEPPFAPRTGESLREVRTSTEDLVADIGRDLHALREAFGRKAGRVEMAKALRALELTIENAAPNAEFAAESFTAHVENVVTKARADIEASVSFAAARGLPSEDVTALGSGKA